jgi:hypothetical protein
MPPRCPCRLPRKMPSASRRFTGRGNHPGSLEDALGATATPLPPPIVADTDTDQQRAARRQQQRRSNGRALFSSTTPHRRISSSTTTMYEPVKRPLIVRSRNAAR